MTSTKHIDVEDPFKEFKIDSHDVLEGLKRSVCPQCKASRMYFCYTCYKYVEGVKENQLPHVKVGIIFKKCFLCFLILLKQLHNI